MITAPREILQRFFGVALLGGVLAACAASSGEPNGADGWGPTGEFCTGAHCKGGGNSGLGGTPGSAAACPTDPQGTPTISCTSSADCASCDPMHQICDTATSKCVPCTTADVTQCAGTEKCVDDKCAPNCPSACNSDNECGQCGGPGHAAHACANHKCAQCSPTYACPAGQRCSANGTCSTKCGGDGSGACQSDSDCGGCGGSATACHLPINGGVGKCGAAASGCSDLGKGVAVLPAPFDRVTNLCSSDSDCAGIGAQINVGKLLRDVTGIHGIHDANIDYPMAACGALTVGTGDTSLSCGVCVPCRVDSDCQNINVDQVASQAFGPLGRIASGLLLTEVFGSQNHNIHMYCSAVAGDYGACVPCPSILSACGAN